MGHRRHPDRRLGRVLDHPSQLHQLTAGYLMFEAGQAPVRSGSALLLEARSPVFGAGAALWAAALALISTPWVMPTLARAFGALEALRFAATAPRIIAGRALTPLSEPLSFLAYPVFVLPLLSWAWWCRKPSR